MGPKAASLTCLLVLALAGCGKSGPRKEVSDDEFKEAFIVSSDPEVHAERVREVERLGATVVCLQNGSGAAPEQALRVYGERVLPGLRGARV